MTLFSLLGPAAAVAPDASPEALVAANVMLGGTALTATCTIVAFLLRRIGTRAKAVTPAEMRALEQKSPRRAAAIALIGAFAWDFATVIDALPALFKGKPMSKAGGAGGSAPLEGPGPHEGAHPDLGGGGHGLD